MNSWHKKMNPLVHVVRIQTLICLNPDWNQRCRGERAPVFLPHLNCWFFPCEDFPVVVKIASGFYATQKLSRLLSLSRPMYQKSSCVSGGICFMARGRDGLGTVTNNNLRRSGSIWGGLWNACVLEQGKNLFPAFCKLFCPQIILLLLRHLPWQFSYVIMFHYIIFICHDGILTFFSR